MGKKTEMLIKALAILLGLAVGWGIVVLMVWLICLCFGWEFTWAMATGVWLIVLLIEGIFKQNKGGAE